MYRPVDVDCDELAEKENQIPNLMTEVQNVMRMHVSVWERRRV